MEKEVRRMLERRKNERGVVEMADTESLAPEGHLLRQVDGAVDFEKLYEIMEPLYSAEEGRRSIDPVVLFKIVLPTLPTRMDTGNTAAIQRSVPNVQPGSYVPAPKTA